METKRFTAELELKNVSEEGAFEGYASVFDVTDHDGDVIVKGAFNNSIQKYADNGKMPKMLWQHNPSIIIGKFTDMKEDERGLYVKGQLITEVEKGKEAYTLMKEGVLDAMSVGFNIVNAKKSAGGRQIDDLDLWEISVVTWGANPDALISSVKSIECKRDFERFLRDSGFTKKDAIAIASNGFEDRSESGQENDAKASVSNLIDKIRG